MSNKNCREVKHTFYTKYSSSLSLAVSEIMKRIDSYHSTTRDYTFINTQKTNILTEMTEIKRDKLVCTKSLTNVIFALSTSNVY
jgi:hypothetical protein